MKEKLKVIIPAGVASVVAGAASLPVWASSSSPDVSGAMTTAVTSIATDALSGLQAIIPVAAPVMGGLIIITVGIRTFRKFTKG